MRSGIADYLLKTNHTIINGSQLPKMPMQQGEFGLGSDRLASGLSARIDTTYYGNNTYGRGPMIFSDLAITRLKSFDVNLGVNNLFNLYSTKYGYRDYGVYVPENVFGNAPGGALRQGSNQNGLPATSYQLIVTARF